MTIKVEKSGGWGDYRVSVILSERKEIWIDVMNGGRYEDEVGVNIPAIIPATGILSPYDVCKLIEALELSIKIAHNNIQFADSQDEVE